MGMAAPWSSGLEGGFDQRGGEAFLPGAGLGEAGLEAVNEGQQFIDLGDDAVLFGEGRERECIKRLSCSLRDLAAPIRYDIDEFVMGRRACQISWNKYHCKHGR